MALDTYTPIQDLAAVNRLLAAVGEAPLTALGSGRPDETWATQILEESSRQVQSMRPWQFNHDRGWEIAPTAGSPHSWVDSNSDTTSLNIFKVPSNVLLWELTPTVDQVGLAAAERLSTDYQEAAAYVDVIADIERNRDGWPAATHDYLYLDISWYIEWDKLPETARDYITLRAMRRFVVQMDKGQGQTPNWLERDLQESFKALLRDQKYPAPINQFETPEHYAIRGMRRARYGFDPTRRGTRR